MPSSLIPCLRYHDAPRMIAWLCQTFGFERHLVVEDGSGAIAHAQLSFGSGMIMLGSARGDTFGRLQGVPEAGRQVTQSTHVVIGDADAIYRRVKAEGGEIVMDLKDEDYGGRGFCREPEGHLWSVGTYEAWHSGSPSAFVATLIKEDRP